MALDKTGNVYVADEWLNRISIFTKDGEWIGKWGTEGNGNGEINKPSGMVFDTDDNMIMVDSQNNRIQKLTKNGEFISSFGTRGSGNGEFNLPWGIERERDFWGPVAVTVDEENRVFVVESCRNRIQVFRRQEPMFRGGGRL